MGSFDKFDETLPGKIEFYSILQDEHISNMHKCVKCVADIQSQDNRSVS